VRLLLTRPEPEATATASRLTTLGHDVLVEPMLRIEFLPPPRSVSPPAAIIFTSGNAVRAVRQWPDAAALGSVPVFAVGEKTAALAADAGFTDIHTAAGDAEALAALVPDALGVTAGAILYPAPRDRAGDIEGRLTGLGFTVHAIEAYRAVAAERISESCRAALLGGAVDGALFFSRRTAAIFRDRVNQAGLRATLREVIFFAMSAQVGEPLKELPSAGMRVASRPDRESLLALLPAGNRLTTAS
jgi:uroporphyrinogen-III synthase